VRVVKVEVSEDELDSLVRLGDERVSTEDVGRVRVRVERRHYRVRVRRRLAFTAAPYHLTTYTSYNIDAGISSERYHSKGV